MIVETGVEDLTTVSERLRLGHHPYKFWFQTGQIDSHTDRQNKHVAGLPCLKKLGSEFSSVLLQLILELIFFT